VGFGLVLVLLFGSAAVGATPVGGERRVSGTKATSDERIPAVAYNTDANQYLVVWEDTRHEGTRGWDIYGRLVGADGRPVGGDFRISGNNATNSELSPAVAYNPKANQYLVVWQDGRDATRDWDVYGRRVSADGKPVGGDFRVSGSEATSDERRPAVAYNSVANQYLVVWQDGRSYATRGYDIFGRRVSADGKPVGGDFRVSGSKAASDEGSPAVAHNPKANQYLVVWQDRRNEGTRGSDIYGRRVSAKGEPVGGDFRVSGRNATVGEYSPTVAHDAKADQFLVVWADERSWAARGSDIFGRRVSADGELVGGDFRISGTKATSDEHRPVVAYNSKANQYLVVWVDERNDAIRGVDIFGRRVSAKGEPVGGDFRVSGKEAISNEWNPAAVYNVNKDEYFVVWMDERDEGTRGWDIYGRRVTG